MIKEITLAKAHILLKRLTKLYRETTDQLDSRDATYGIEEWKFPVEKVQETRDLLVKFKEISAAIVMMRSAVAKHNTLSGVSSLLADVAVCERDLHLLERLANSTPIEVTQALFENEIQTAQNLDFADRVNFTKSIRRVASYIDESTICEIKQQIAETKKRINEMQDEISRINHLTTFEVSVEDEIADSINL